MERVTCEDARHDAARALEEAWLRQFQDHKFAKLMENQPKFQDDPQAIKANLGGKRMSSSILSERDFRKREAMS